MNNNTPRKTNNIITQHRTYTSIEQIRNTQGWDSIHIQSGGIEYRNRFPRVWGPLCAKSGRSFSLFIKKQYPSLS